MIKERKFSKETLLKKFKKMNGSYGEEAVAKVKNFDVNAIHRIVNRFEMLGVNIDCNKKDLDYKDFRKFPKRVQKEIISVLASYNHCHVNFEFGHWDVTPDTCIKSYYGKDHRVFGTFYYDKLVNKIKGLKAAREKYNKDTAEMYRNLLDSWWN